MLEAGSSRPFDEIEAHLRKLEKEKKVFNNYMHMFAIVYVLVTITFKQC